MSWYKIFYWITIADGVKSFFDVFSNLFTTLFGIFFIVWIILLFSGSDSSGNWTEKDLKSLNHWRKMIRGSWIVCCIFMVIMWGGYVFTPTKKDALLIVAGGAVANFITSDSSAKEIPAELTLLVREHLKNEIDELKNPIKESLSIDTLKDKTREELIELLKKK
jgi:hypothetical protein